MYDTSFRFSGSGVSWTGSDTEAKAILGGKGAGLVMMARDGLNVPPGFTLTTEVCNDFRKFGTKTKVKEFMLFLMEAVKEDDAWLNDQSGFAPLVSVRSGAPISMPGMMDTILNVGMTDATYPDWANRLGERAALDSYRRLVQMLGATAYGIPMEVFEFQLAAVKKADDAKLDSDLTVDALNVLLKRYLKVFKENKGFDFPQTREAQMEAAIKAVFESWMNPRAIEYRKINKIDDAMGTAVTVQAMVFGNMGEDSGTGVLFSRDPSTGAPGMMGEFLTNAQGEDVVAGIRTPLNVSKMKDMKEPTEEVDGATWPIWPGVYEDLQALCEKLETSYSDMEDIEFTVQQGKLYVLQSRTGKRSARAAFRIAVDQVAAGVIDHKTVFKRLTIGQFKVVRRPSIDPKFKATPDFIGLPACPGVATGKPVFSAQDAVDCTEPCILVTHETNPNDIAGMAKAAGILTQTGGATSHAAVVARAMDKTCIVGCTTLDWTTLKKAKRVTIDGSTGRVWLNVEVPVIDSSDAPEVKTVMGWCRDELNVSQTASVDLGMSAGPHRVMAAHWWGNTEAMEAVIVGLVALPHRSHIVLDLRNPNDFAEPCDGDLENCFGTSSNPPFLASLLNSLKKNAKKLHGMGLAFLPVSDAQLNTWSSLGFGVVDTQELQFMKNVPLDYAAFTVLAR